MESRYKKGDVVVERTRPSNQLIVSRYDDGLYYCKVEEDPSRKELVYWERELKQGTILTRPGK